MTDASVTHSANVNDIDRCVDAVCYHWSQWDAQPGSETAATRMVESCQNLAETLSVDPVAMRAVLAAHRRLGSTYEQAARAVVDSSRG